MAEERAAMAACFRALCANDVRPIGFPCQGFRYVCRRADDKAARLMQALN